MKITRLKILILFGLIAILGVIIMQLVLIDNAYKLQKKDTENKIYFALQDVLEQLYSNNNQTLVLSDQVKKMSDDYYTINVNNEFQAEILEHYLTTEFKKLKLDLNFEYAYYNCSSNQMIDGYYIDTNNKKFMLKCKSCFVKVPNLTYFFAVRFPEINEVYLQNLNKYWIFTAVLFLVLLIYVYSVIIMLKQQRYSELQKDFINNMTHEFKTPLSSILIASDFLKNQTEIKANKRFSKYNQIIIDQTKKLNQHIEKILYVAKTESKQVFIEKKSFNLNKTIVAAIDNCNLKHNLTNQITFNETDDFFVVADEFHVSNLIFNLLDNAVKYANSSPEIKVEINQKMKKTELVFTDNGFGIPEKDLPFIYDKFYRVHRKSQKDIPGFGIGLSYVKRICTLHAWKIKIKNNPTKGINVTIAIKK